MTQPFGLTLSLFLAFATALGGCSKPGEPLQEADTRSGSRDSVADLVVLNGDIYTVDEQHPRVRAFAVKDRKFMALGSSAAIEQLVGAGTRVIDVGGRTVLPGLVDGHTHLSEGTGLATGVDLSDIADPQEWLRIIREKIAIMEPGQWLVGGAWNHLLRADGELPTLQMLDSVAPDNPVILFDIDHHTYWVNSKAFEAAGMTRDTQVPEGGEIGLDQNGELSGILYESAGRLIAESPALRAAEDPVAGLLAVVQKANSLGITSVHDMSLRFSENFLDLLATGELTLRVWEGGFANDDPDFVDQFIARREQLRQRRDEVLAQQEDRGPLFELGYVKLMIDGVLSTRTAILKKPYSDKPDAHPAYQFTPEQLSHHVIEANKADIPVSIHAVGDRGVAESVEAFASAREYPTSVPNRIEHIELIEAQDLQAMRANGIAASMQPRHANCCVGAYVLDRVGAQRTETEAYVWKSMLDEGINLALGSDWPTSPLDPLAQLQDAQTRQSTYRDGSLQQWDGGRNALSFEQALHGYTQGSANLSGWRDQIGSISVGKWADFVILDRALPGEGFRDLRRLAVESTWLAGDEVYRKP